MKLRLRKATHEDKASMGALYERHACGHGGSTLDLGWVLEKECKIGDKRMWVAVPMVDENNNQLN